MHSAAILADENTKLREANQRQRRKQQQRRQYIATGDVLQAQQGQLLAREADMVGQQGDQNRTNTTRRAPPTCSICHIQGHNRTQCARR